MQSCNFTSGCAVRTREVGHIFGAAATRTRRDRESAVKVIESWSGVKLSRIQKFELPFQTVFKKISVKLFTSEASHSQL